MDLRQLEEKGGFVPSAPIVKEVSWTHTPLDATEEVTDTFTVHVKKLSFGAIEQLLSPDNKQSGARQDVGLYRCNDPVGR